jgi:hypothetical protein
VIEVSVYDWCKHDLVIVSNMHIFMEMHDNFILI